MNSFNYPNLKYIYIFCGGGGARVSECFYKGSKSKKNNFFFFWGGGGGGGGGQVAGG